ncbi:MAG: hypothetical protein L3K17_08745 [Thermoplasmata archaeon]|nr:hypothetical protein [Thermoplasmata archaeon]
MTNDGTPSIRGAIGRRILVVEDSSSARRLLQGLLLRLGIGLPDLRMAATVPEALQLFASWEPEIAIVDLQLRGSPDPSPSGVAGAPGNGHARNGAELALQFLQRNPALKVIICSASEPEGTELQPLLKKGRIFSMMKPVLASRVAEVLAAATALPPTTRSAPSR